MRGKKEIGITLIALIITIIVMLILVGVTMTVALQEGLFETTQIASEQTSIARDKEVLYSEVLGFLNNQGEIDVDAFVAAYNGKTIEGYTITKSGNNAVATKGETVFYIDKTGGISETSTQSNKVESQTLILAETSYVGYYANLDDDPEPEGIIYLDLLDENSLSGQWADSDGAFNFNLIANAKDYYISQEKYNGAFGNEYVLTVAGTGNERFYIMALEDYGNTYTWENAMALSYGDGWYVPSREQWSAFIVNIGITTSNYLNKGFDDYYWSSSECNNDDAWEASFSDGYMNICYKEGTDSIRFGKTF